MKKAEIHSKRSIEKILEHSTFVSSRFTDPKTVYMPIGELHGVKILRKYTVKKQGEYLILK